MLEYIPTELELFFSLQTSPSLQMSLKVFNRLVQTNETVEYDRYLKLDGDLSEVLGLQTNVTVLKSHSESQSLEFRRSTRTPLKLITGISFIMHN